MPGTKETPISPLVGRCNDGGLVGQHLCCGVGSLAKREAQVNRYRDFALTSALLERRRRDDSWSSEKWKLQRCLGNLLLLDCGG
jgi:hypothetical protein